MNKQKKIFHCALLKKKIYLPKRSFMIAQTISLDILYSLQDCNVSCIAAAPLLRYPEMSAIDLKKLQKTAEIILGYHGQSEVERYFQDSKDTDHLSFQPHYHWTDQKLHVHAFYCNLGLLLTGVLCRRLALKGFLLSPEVLLEKLHDLQEATLLYPQEKAAPPQVSYCLVRQDKTQKQLFESLNLAQYTKGNPSKST